MTITQHAFDRANERLSLNRDSFSKMAEKALSHGIKHSETSGSLNRFISKLYFEYKNDNIRIYAENVFVFKGEYLLTVYLLPRKFKKLLKKINDRKTA